MCVIRQQPVPGAVQGKFRSSLVLAQLCPPLRNPVQWLSGVSLVGRAALRRIFSDDQQQGPPGSCYLSFASNPNAGRHPQVHLYSRHLPTCFMGRGPTCRRDPTVWSDEFWEPRGDVPNVVFSCANPVVDGTVYVFYGGVDHVIGLATYRLDDLLGFTLHRQ